MLEAGRVVVATHGRDKDGFYLVTGTAGGRVLLADGGRRKLQAPKSKNPAHLQPTPYTIAPELVTGNSRLKRLLQEINQREAANKRVN